MDVQPPSPKVKFKDTVVALEDDCHILESCGHIQTHYMLGSVIDKVAGLKAITSRQTTIHNFFTRIDKLTQS